MERGDACLAACICACNFRVGIPGGSCHSRIDQISGMQVGAAAPCHTLKCQRRQSGGERPTNVDSPAFTVALKYQTNDRVSFCWNIPAIECFWSQQFGADQALKYLTCSYPEMPTAELMHLTFSAFPPPTLFLLWSAWLCRFCWSQGGHFPSGFQHPLAPCLRGAAQGGYHRE